MTKAQALSLVNALEARKMPCDAQLRFDAAGAEMWSVQLQTTQVYSGADISALATYCANNQLILTAQFDSLGVT